MMRLLELVLLSSLILPSCVPTGGSYGSNLTTVNRGMVVINGVELTEAQELEFEQLAGERLQPGRYFVTESGLMGREGEPATIDLRGVIRARQGQVAKRGSIHNSSGDSHITSDGNGCTIFSTSSGSFSSGC